MKALAAVALAVVACKSPPEPAKREPSPFMMTLPPRPPRPQPASVDLLHAVPARVAVSSVVANVAYSPFDLADGDLATAWNSRSGDDHAWIAFRVPAGAHVQTVRMTVGFTAKGPEGDYFTMNPRIRRVRVTHAGAATREVALDPESRGLQDLAIDGNGGDYRIDVVETVAGSRKDWREICVSELQVVGTPPPGTKPADQLEISAGSLDAPALEDSSLELTPLPQAASIADECKRLLARKEEPCEPWESCSKPDAPVCGATALGSAPALPPSLPAGWKHARWIGSHGALRWQTQCHLAIDFGDRVATLEDLGEDCGTAIGFSKFERFEVAMHDGWLVVVTASGTPRSLEPKTRVDELLRVCGAVAGTPACTEPIEIGQFDHVEQSSGPPGADGLDVHDEIVWEFRYKIAGNVLTISKDSGKPDPDFLTELGRHRLKP